MTITSNNVSSNTTGQSASGNTALPGMDKLANEQTFLQLFVSQLKNQDPLNPADGTQFVTQLAQFSELEQVIGINQNVGAIRQQVAPSSSSNNSTQGTSAT
jgi:flagellar basal-body rod modification protein FlgD